MQTKLPRWVRAALLYLVVAHGVPGAWALLRPRDFYDRFPGFGRVWVAVDGPYNEHLIRDVGGFFLALAVLCLLTVSVPRLVAVRATAICLLVFNGPHWWYHLHHLHGLPRPDQLAVAGSLSFSVVVLILLLFHSFTLTKSQPVSTTVTHE